MSVRRLLCCLLLAMPVFASAQEGPRPCRADGEKYCSQSTGKQLNDCLLDHQQDVSDACYETLKQRMANQQGLKACKQDAEQYCKGIEPGGGRIVRCLMDHQKDLADDCYDTLARKRKGGGQ